MSRLYNQKIYSFGIDVIMNIGNTTGIIFDIQRFSVHDGPGIRTTIFIKGCPLRCLWCHNPESQRIDSELFFEEGLCVYCGECIKICSEKVHTIINTKREIKRNLCRRCGKCVEACVTGALMFKGRSITADEVLNEVSKDIEYYNKSGGGITLSGGEPLAQPSFIKALLVKSKEQGIHTAIETCGYAGWAELENILNLIDLIMYDIKCLDLGLHKKYCGVSNTLIMKNLERIAVEGKDIVVRIPLIPGITDTEKNLNQIGEFLERLGIKNVELVPYHAFSEEKCRALGRDHPLRYLQTQSPQELERIRQIISGFVLEARIGI